MSVTFVAFTLSIGKYTLCTYFKLMIELHWFGSYRFFFFTASSIPFFIYWYSLMWNMWYFFFFCPIGWLHECNNCARETHVLSTCEWQTKIWNERKSLALPGAWTQFHLSISIDQYVKEMNEFQLQEVIFSICYSIRKFILNMLVFY